jgi:hypothetical protein
MKIKPKGRTLESIGTQNDQVAMANVECLYSDLKQTKRLNLRSKPINL